MVTVSVGSVNNLVTIWFRGRCSLQGISMALIVLLRMHLTTVLNVGRRMTWCMSGPVSRQVMMGLVQRKH